MVHCFKLYSQTKCTPVGCIPPAAVAICWRGVSASVHAGIPPLRCGPGDPPGCGPGDPPRCGPGDPPGSGLGDALGMGLQPPQGVSLETPQARPLNFPLGCGPGDPPKPDLSTPPPVCGPGDVQCMLGYHPPTPL